MLEGHLLLNLENKVDLEDLVLQQADDVTPWNYEVTDENLDKTSNKIDENCVKRENKTFENSYKEKPYKCKICSADFWQIVEIDLHIASLHQEKKLNSSNIFVKLSVANDELRRNKRKAVSDINFRDIYEGDIDVVSENYTNDQDYEQDAPNESDEDPDDHDASFKEKSVLVEQVDKEDYHGTDDNEQSICEDNEDIASENDNNDQDYEHDASNESDEDQDDHENSFKEKSALVEQGDKEDKSDIEDNEQSIIAELMRLEKRACKLRRKLLVYGKDGQNKKSAHLNSEPKFQNIDKATLDDYKCPYCEKVYSHKMSLWKHIKKFHKNVDIDVELKIKVCKFCGKKVSQLTQHMKRVHGHYQKAPEKIDIVHIEAETPTKYRPKMTWAQLVAKAIEMLGGSGTMQKICEWIMETYPYFNALPFKKVYTNANFAVTNTKAFSHFENSWQVNRDIWNTTTRRKRRKATENFARPTKNGTKH